MITLLSFNVGAQDMILKKDGTKVKAKVKEILDSEVKYKKYENVNGPIYLMRKSDIILINYENGTQDIFSEEANVQVQFLHDNLYLLPED